MPETSVEITGTPKACASIRTLGRPSRSPEEVRREGSTKRSARFEDIEDEIAALGAMPCDPVGDAQRRGQCLELARRAGPAGMLKAPVRFAWDCREGAQEIGVALLFDGAPDRRDSEAVGFGFSLGRGRKARKIKAVVDEVKFLGCGLKHCR